MCVLVATKMDRETDMEVTREEGVALAIQLVSLPCPRFTCLESCGIS